MDPVEKAAQVLKHDGIVIYPTDTVYGLGGDAFSDEAILKVYEAKRRPLSQPISIAVSSCDMMFGVAKVEEFAAGFIDSFLPGPVTVVLPARNSVPDMLTGGTGLIGIRFPRHPVALRLFSLIVSPITATSAATIRNPRYIKPSATSTDLKSIFVLIPFSFLLICNSEIKPFELELIGRQR